MMDLVKIREAAERAARLQGVEVVEVEWKMGKQRFLRIYIDRAAHPANPSGAGPANPSEAGISHLDCERVSQQLSVILDVEDLVPGPSYILEVSSPGLDRKLRTPADFERFTGRLARVSLGCAVENSKFFEGRLAGCADGMVRMEVRGREVLLPLADIRKANLVVEF